MKKESRMQPWILFLPEIKQLIAEKNFFELRHILSDLQPMDLAEGFKELSKEEKLIVFRLLKFNKAIALFEDLDSEEQVFLIENLDTNPLEKLLEDMPTDEKTKLIKKLPDRVKKKLLHMLKKEDLNVVQSTLNYEPDTAGAVMNTYFIPLSPNMTVKQCIEKIHSLAKFRKYSSLHAFYVVNEEGKLLGGISLRKLIAAPSDMKISEIMGSVNFIKVSAVTPLEEVAKMFAKYDLIIAPVIDEEDRLIGIITVDDVIDIINAINTKQIYSVGKMSAEEGEEIKYSAATPLYLVKRRIGWLIFLLVVNFLSGNILKTFESALTAVVALTFFIPMLLDTGGNAGSQTAVTIIRSFATGDVNFNNIWKVVKLELLSGSLLSIALGFVAFSRAYLIGEGILLSITVALSMIAVIFLATFSGLVLPILSKKIGIDPALSSAPIITTIVDVGALIIYFKIAQMILPQLKILP
ncbi:MAG: magnesium transporter [Endomicrobiia bacterium]